MKKNFILSDNYFDNRYLYALLIAIACSMQSEASAQSLSITYTGPQIYSIGAAIPSLSPSVTGGPAASGGQTTQAFVGSGSLGSGNATGSSASFYNPLNTATDASGNIYVADAGNHLIRKITPLGVVSTLAGYGSAGYMDGTGTSAMFQHPSALAVDAAGNVFVSDQQNHRIRKITPAGVVTTFAGSGSTGSTDGTGTSASFSSPIGLAFDASGNLYVADYSNNKIRRITPAAVVSTYAGTGTAGMGNGASLSATFRNPMGVAFDATGNLYVADRANHAIRKITSGGTVSTLAGNGAAGSSNGTGSAASFNQPNNLCVDMSSNIYVADQSNNMIRKITNAGVVTTFGGTTSPSIVNGTGSIVRFTSTYGLSIDMQGNIYVAQNSSNLIRKIITQPYNIIPNLPAGLTFNNTSGIISGTPTVASPTTIYSIQAFNLTHSSNIHSLSVSVNAASVGIKGSSNQNYKTTYTAKVFAFLNHGEILSASTDKSQVETVVEYFDGLGRPLQTVHAMGNPDGTKDIVTPIEYDDLGRPKQAFLPYTSSGSYGSYKAGGLTDVYTFYQAPPTGIVQTSYPISKSIYEQSPLNRVSETGSAGAVWQPLSGTISGSGHTMKREYKVNAVADTVKFWLLSGTSASTSSNYSAGQLDKTITKDENWVSGNAGIVEEYTDKEGKLICKRIWESNTIARSTYYIYDDLKRARYILPANFSLTSFNESITQFDQMIFGFHYDALGRVIEKKVPGKGWEEMVYDKLDRMVMSRDAVQNAGGKWFFVKYDGVGRLIIKGIVSSTATRASQQSLVDASSFYSEQRDNSNTTGNGSGYTNTAKPDMLGAVYHVINYFDDYNFFGNSFGNPVPGQSNATRSLLIGSKINVLGTSTLLLKVNYYDDRGRVVQIKAQNHLTGTDVFDSSYDFPGTLISSVQNHTVGSTTTMIYKDFEYDHLRRIKRTLQKIGHSGSPQVVLSEQMYNDIGQLKDKKLHNSLNTNAFTYNERGWLKTISSNEFSVRLRYNDGTNPQYSGNIANQDWGANTTYPNSFTYSYDKFNRLLSAVSTGVVMSEVINYDPVGNIKTMNRDAAGSATYNYSGSRLMSITGGGLATGSWAYDLNGNATTDGRTGAAITYNEFNLPKTAIKTGLNLTYTYDAVGNKLTKSNGITASTRHYIYGVEYNGTNIEIIQTGEGVARNNSGVYSYEYNLVDHLGNTRYSFNKHPVTGLIQRLQGDDFYAFGKRKSISPTSTINKYLYTGKEIQDELNSAGKEGQYDFVARFYDAEIGRWNVVDPVNQTFSGYDFCGNNPVLNVDPDGRVFGTVLGFLKGVTRAIGSGGLEFWNAGSGYVGDAWRQADPFLDGTAGNNGFKIDMGLFKGSLSQIVSRFTWELPQTILGYAGSNIHNLAGGVKGVSYWGGATAVESYSIWGGITLGSFINGGSGLRADPNNSLFQHEYGHYLQSQTSGLAYLTTYGVPSLLSGSSRFDHNLHPVEQDANVRAFDYFERYEPGTRWNIRSNPILDPNFELKPKWYDYLGVFGGAVGIFGIGFINSLGYR